MPALITPTPALHVSWLESRDEWGRGTHQDGSGLRAGDEVDTAAGFAAWVDRLIRSGDESIPAEPGWVHATYWWIVEADTYLGSITLRHRLNPYLRRTGGHLGYGIRPSRRGQGLATWALGEVLRDPRTRDLRRVLLTCRDDNLASGRVIARHGGVLDGIAETENGLTCRYWIDLGRD